MSRLYAILAAIFAICLMLLYVFYNKSEQLEKELSRVEKEHTSLKEDIKLSNDIGNKLEKLIKEVSDNTKQHKESMDEESRKDPVYVNCVQPSSGVRILEDALLRKSPR